MLCEHMRGRSIHEAFEGRRRAAQGSRRCLPRGLRHRPKAGYPARQGEGVGQRRPRLQGEGQWLKHDRPALAACLAYLREGDTLVVTRADRIARSAAHLLTTVQDLKKKGVAVRFLDQPELNTEGKNADFLLTVLAAVAQLERDIMDEKRRDG